MNKIQKNLPQHCPSCDAQLKIKKLYCDKCGTEVDGLFDQPILHRISREDQAFILDFLKASGSLKEMSKLLNLSYPSVRNRLDDIINRIKIIDNETTSN